VNGTQLSPYLCVRDATAAIAFYVEVFGAREEMCLMDPSGSVAHAELRFPPGPVLMLSSEFPELGVCSPQHYGGCSSAVYLQVAAVDAVVAAAAERGATVLREPADQFFGERVARIQDPWGQLWMLAQPLEELPVAEVEARWDNLFSEGEA
jgi:PhnB protein